MPFDEYDYSRERPALFTEAGAHYALHLLRSLERLPKAFTCFRALSMLDLPPGPGHGLSTEQRRAALDYLVELGLLRGPRHRSAWQDDLYAKPEAPAGPSR